MQFSAPSVVNYYLAEHAQLLLSSYQRLTGKVLMSDASPQALYEAPFCLVSHNTAVDPIFNYANQTALALFDMQWRDFTQLPSRLSAANVNRAERARLLAAVASDGFIDDYAGERVSSTGQRFWIEQATVWNLVNEQGVYCGQAAMFAHWSYLET